MKDYDGKQGEGKGIILSAVELREEATEGKGGNRREETSAVKKGMM